MPKVKLRRGVYGDGTVFSVDIKSNAEVKGREDCWHVEHGAIPTSPMLLTLYLAGKKEGDETTWMKCDSTLKSFLKRGKIRHWL
ncbi:LOW QUALITY PROTEIN: Crinkler (CRN) family protein [Phytophthora palmivora]|uniref:Crinkler (CRN) family protein n=1 Tax=Phytophthora palmivora TaxID=4796 RepID=A0A2P4YGF9_9STRA|nr:LOW QUALITY PROTEIN: Crinkler (CRN) family protein [Phytophthora palmivora]